MILKQLVIEAKEKTWLELDTDYIYFEEWRGQSLYIENVISIINAKYNDEYYNSEFELDTTAKFGAYRNYLWGWIQGWISTSDWQFKIYTDNGELQAKIENDLNELAWLFWKYLKIIEQELLDWDWQTEYWMDVQCKNWMRIAY